MADEVVKENAESKAEAGVAPVAEKAVEAAPVLPEAAVAAVEAAPAEVVAPLLVAAVEVAPAEAVEPAAQKPEREHALPTDQNTPCAELLMAARSRAIGASAGYRKLIEEACAIFEVATNEDKAKIEAALREFVNGGVPLPAALDAAGVDQAIVSRPTEGPLTKP